ncbi:MAG: hypothetical protein ACETWR_07035 [Anaerolineae bacterium]
MTDMISAETVTRVWQDMAQASVDEAPLFVNQMRVEQPVILAYLLAVGDSFFNQHERELIFYLGMVVWQMMRQSKRRLRKVAEKKLMQAEEANFDFLERLSASPEADFESATQAMIATYPEPEVLRYIVEAIMEEEEDYDPDDPPIRDEYRGLAFVHLKTVLDALASSLAAAPRSRRRTRRR